MVAIALLLLGAACFLIFRPGSRAYAEESKNRSSNNVAKSTNRPFETDSNDDGSRPRDSSKRIRWRSASELPDPFRGSGLHDEDSPVYLRAVVFDPERKNLRIGLRLEQSEPIEPEKLTVNVDLLDLDGNKIMVPENVDFKWSNAKEAFEDSPAPMLEVSSQQPISRLNVTLSYDGTEVETRTYELPAPAKAR